MRVNPEVKITKLKRRPDGSFGPEAKFGARTNEQEIIQTLATDLLRRLAEQAKDVFLLEWEGGKVPRGAVVNGKTIAWTQHGIVTSQKSKDIGTYERTVEFGGVGRKEQKMLVFAN